MGEMGKETKIGRGIVPASSVWMDGRRGVEVGAVVWGRWACFRYSLGLIKRAAEIVPFLFQCIVAFADL